MICDCLLEGEMDRESVECFGKIGDPPRGELILLLLLLYVNNDNSDSALPDYNSISK